MSEINFTAIFYRHSAERKLIRTWWRIPFSLNSMCEHSPRLWWPCLHPVLSLAVASTPAAHHFPFICPYTYKTRSALRCFGTTQPGRLRAARNAQVCFYYSCRRNTISSRAWFHQRRGEEQIGPEPGYISSNQTFRKGKMSWRHQS